MVLAPGHAHLHAIKFLHCDSYLAPRQIVPRHCASGHFVTFVTIYSHISLIKIVTRHSYNSHNLYPDGKNHAIPSLHRDSFVAKVPGPYPDASSGNTTSPYCRAVTAKAEPEVQLHFNFCIFAKTSNYGLNNEKTQCD